jgi:methylmalonyl-CoA mutase cobalamin-binding domain/chain
MVTDPIRLVYEAILNGDVDGAGKYALNAVEAGLDPLVVFETGGADAIKAVGEQFANFEVFLPELMLAADAVKVVSSVLHPYIQARGASPKRKGRVLIGTVAGDIHDIGKNLVAALLAANGFEVVDIGVDVSSRKFLEAAEQSKPDILAISALLSTSSYYQEEIIKYMSDAGCRDQYFVIVGGGPVTPEWAKSIGADGYGRTAAHAVTLCEQLMEIGKSHGRPAETMIVS